MTAPTTIQVTVKGAAVVAANDGQVLWSVYYPNPVWTTTAVSTAYTLVADYSDGAAVTTSNTSPIGTPQDATPVIPFDTVEVWTGTSS